MDVKWTFPNHGDLVLDVKWTIPNHGYLGDTHMHFVLMHVKWTFPKNGDLPVMLLCLPQGTERFCGQSATKCSEATEAVQEPEDQ